MEPYIKTIHDAIHPIILNIRCRFGLHLYPNRWSKREKVKTAFNETAFMQFKECPNCGAVKSRYV